MSGPNRNSKRATPARRTAKPTRQVAGASKPRPEKSGTRGKSAGGEERPRFAKAGAERAERPRFAKAGAERSAEAKPFRGSRPFASARPVKGDRPARLTRSGERSEPGRYQGKPRAGESKPYVRKLRGESKPLASERKPALGRGHRVEARPRAGERKVEARPRAGERKMDEPRPGKASAPVGRKARGPAARDEAHAKRPVRDAARGKGAARSAFPRVADARALGGDIRATGKRQFYVARPKKGEGDAAPVVVERGLPRVPVARSQLASKEPHPGMWIFTTREGSEQDLVDELVLAKVIDPAPRVIGPALVLSPKVPKRDGRPIELTFARQGFEILQAINSLDLDEKTKRIVATLRKQLGDAKQYALHVWVPDSTEANPLASLADELDRRIETELSRALPELTRIDDATLRRAAVKLAQVCILDTERAVAGIMHANRTPSLAKGGRTRVRITGDFPSRAARKIEEALAWLGVAPGPGEVCVDLGAAPGGWTYVLAERRARVIAVDPAKLRPDIAARKGVRHVMDSAFTFTPDEHVDWLFCDMAWRPLEVAALLAKWGRKHWARIVVANIKLPMTKKAEILARIRTILEVEGEWKHVRVKQLYHDREEITLTAVRA